MQITCINNEADYDLALKRMETIFDAEENSPEWEEADELSLLIEKYEEIHYPIDASNAIEQKK